MKKLLTIIGVVFVLLVAAWIAGSVIESHKKDQSILELRQKAERLEEKIGILEAEANEAGEKAAAQKEIYERRIAEIEKMKRAAPQRRKIPAVCASVGVVSGDKDPHDIMTMLCEEITLQAGIVDFHISLSLKYEELIKQADGVIENLELSNSKLQTAIIGHKEAALLRQNIFNLELSQAKKKAFRRGAIAGGIAAGLVAVLLKKLLPG